MNDETKNEKSIETPASNGPIVEIKDAPRLLGGLSIKTRIRAGIKKPNPG